MTTATCPGRRLSALSCAECSGRPVPSPPTWASSARSHPGSGSCERLDLTAALRGIGTREGVCFLCPGHDPKRLWHSKGSVMCGTRRSNSRKPWRGAAPQEPSQEPGREGGKGPSEGPTGLL